MKAFVIKNKEGKYKTNEVDSYGYNSFTVNEIWQEDVFDDYELAREYCLQDEEPVKITIAEGNLEEENKKLKEQLAEKDKEIEELYKILDSQKRHIASMEQPFRGRGTRRTGNVILDFELLIRKQVCDEIRQAFNKEDFWLYGDNNKIISIHEDEFNEILDQIEQANKE